jgi:hypothetical protein
MEGILDGAMVIPKAIKYNICDEILPSQCGIVKPTYVGRRERTSFVFVSKD